jgi:hypothetical protein
MMSLKFTKLTITAAVVSALLVVAAAFKFRELEVAAANRDMEEDESQASSSVDATPGSLLRQASGGASSTPAIDSLDEAVQWAKRNLARISAIEDYSCVLVKREWVNGHLIGPQTLAIKVRQHPFSVYTCFLTPAEVRDQEAIYVQGQHNDKVLAHCTGVRHRLLGTVALKPTGPIALHDNRYPITELGLLRLTERLIEIGESERPYGECRVTTSAGLEVAGRGCSCIMVEHPRRQSYFKYNLAKIYIDDELQLPIRFEAYEWSPDAEGKPRLVEEYAYTRLKLNNGFTDADFETSNPEYAFSRGARKAPTAGERAGL